MASPALLYPKQHLLVVSPFSQSLLCGAAESPAVYLGGRLGSFALVGRQSRRRTLRWKAYSLVVATALLAR